MQAGALRRHCALLVFAVVHTWCMPFFLANKITTIILSKLECQISVFPIILLFCLTPFTSSVMSRKKVSLNVIDIVTSTLLVPLFFF